MGTSKLLLEVGGQTLIDVVLRGWRDSNVDATVVVVRADDAELVDRCQRWGVDVAVAESEPPEMRDSLVIGLDYIELRRQPRATDAWLVAPADLPGMNATIVDQVLASYDPARPRITVASVAGRRRHPVLLPWSEAGVFRNDPVGGGLDGFLEQKSARIDIVELDSRAALDDLDTPADLRRWTNGG